MSDTNIAPEKISINGVDYSLDDVGQLVELGNKYKKIEEDQNTSIDKILPEFTKSTQRNKELEELLSGKDQELAEFKKAQEKLKEAETPEEIIKAKAALRQLGGVDEDYLKQNKYMTQQEAEEFWRQKRFEESQVDALNKEGARLEEEINGTDGRVPFNYRSVLAYANAYGKEDLRSAYDEMYENTPQNKSWQEQQLAAEERKKGLVTITGGGRKEPSPVKVTNDNLSANLSELLQSTIGKE